MAAPGSCRLCDGPDDAREEVERRYAAGEPLAAIDSPGVLSRHAAHTAGLNEERERNLVEAPGKKGFNIKVSDAAGVDEDELSPDFQRRNLRVWQRALEEALRENAGELTFTNLHQGIDQIRKLGAQILLGDEAQAAAALEEERIPESRQRLLDEIEEELRKQGMRGAA